MRAFFVTPVCMRFFFFPQQGKFAVLWRGRRSIQAGFFVWGNLFPFWKNVKSVNLLSMLQTK
jgi:hypothetical protein